MTPRYYCPSCKIPANSVRCSKCGGDTVENDIAARSYTIFDHARGNPAAKRAPTVSHAKRNSL